MNQRGERERKRENEKRETNPSVASLGSQEELLPVRLRLFINSQM